MIDIKTAIRSIETGVRLQPVYTLVGAEFILVQRVVDTIIKKLSERTAGEVPVERYSFDEEGAGDALLACQTMSLFAEQRVVVLRQCTPMLPNGKSKYDVAGLERYLADPVQDQVLVLTVLGEKLDERKKLVKLAKKFEVVDCNTPKEPMMIEFLKQIAQNQGVRIEEAAVQELVRRSGSLSAAYMELVKLRTYCDYAPIRASDVMAVVAAPVEDNVFSWIDAVVRGEAQSAFDGLRDVERAGYDSIALLALMARQFRLMWYARSLSASGQTDAAIAAQAGAHPYAVKVAREQSRSFKSDTLTHLLTAAADAEYGVKSGRRDPQFALQYLVLLTLASTANRTRAK